MVPTTHFETVVNFRVWRQSGAPTGSVISGAYGGFSNLWGAQIMPFSAATFERWPIKSSEMQDHYRFALGEMALAGDQDDLADLFPLMTEPRPLPQLAERTMMVLGRYEARRAHIQSLGITMGRARLAFQAESCTRCGLCMTGCPHGLIYSASQTFDRLRKDKRSPMWVACSPWRSPRKTHVQRSSFAIFGLVG